MRKVAVNVFLLLIVGAVFLSQGCSDEVEITPEEVIPSDSTLSLLTAEIGYSAVVDGLNKRIENFDVYRGNGIDSSWNTSVCGSPFFAYKNQKFHFSNFLHPQNRNGMTFNIYKCADIFTDSIEKDSMFVIGNYDYGNAFGVEGVSVSYIDDTLGLFSTEFSPKITSQDSSSFNISDIVRNEDGFSRFLIAGTFACFVYNLNGDSLIIEDGQFISRAGRDY